MTRSRRRLSRRATVPSDRFHVPGVTASVVGNDGRERAQNRLPAKHHLPGGARLDRTAPRHSRPSITLAARATRHKCGGDFARGGSRSVVVVQLARLAKGSRLGSRGFMHDHRCAHALPEVRSMFHLECRGKSTRLRATRSFSRRVSQSLRFNHKAVRAS